MELKDIYSLWDRFDQSTASSMELDFQGMHLSLKREAAAAAPIATAVPVTAPAVSPVQTPMSTTESQVTTEAKKEIKAPLVGIFYQASSPGEKPFVEVGQKVSKGDVVGIIEAMKVMNEITAQEDGIVEEILVGDATMVEYDQVLFTLK